MTVVDSRVRKGSLIVDGQTFSCQPTNVNIAPEHSGGDEEVLEVLCGDTISDAASATLTATLNMVAIQDFTNATGLIGFAWANDSQEKDFAWRPTEDADDTWVGRVTVQAITAGGDVAARLTTDVAWPITYLTLPTKLGGNVVIGSATAITGVTAGAPGSFTPDGAALPSNLTALKADTVVGDTGSAKPSTAWTTGQYVALADASHAYWDGTAWASGQAA
jgi:hypothetical protein